MSVQQIGRQRILSPTFGWACAEWMVRLSWNLQISQLHLHLLHWPSSNGFKILPSVWNGTKLPSSDSCKFMGKKKDFLKLVYWLPQSTSLYIFVRLALPEKAWILFICSLFFRFYLYFYSSPEAYLTQNSTTDSLTASKSWRMVVWGFSPSNTIYRHRSCKWSCNNGMLFSEVTNFIYFRAYWELLVTDGVTQSQNELFGNTWCRLGQGCVSNEVFCPVVSVEAAFCFSSVLLLVTAQKCVAM